MSLAHGLRTVASMDDVPPEVQRSVAEFELPDGYEDFPMPTKNNAQRSLIYFFGRRVQLRSDPKKTQWFCLASAQYKRVTVDQVCDIIVEIFRATRHEMLELLRREVADTTVPLIYLSLTAWPSVSEPEYLLIELWFIAQGSFELQRVVIGMRRLRRRAHGDDPKDSEPFVRWIDRKLEFAGIKSEQIALIVMDEDVEELLGSGVREALGIWLDCPSSHSCAGIGNFSTKTSNSLLESRNVGNR
ncbi:hypothetical protein PINS_up014172 [Pythium insidiosum]|nr:hypothetical protein PINS_up014172 [Pythium insidiosum]